MDTLLAMVEFYVEPRFGKMKDGERGDIDAAAKRIKLVLTALQLRDRMGCTFKRDWNKYFGPAVPRQNPICRINRSISGHRRLPSACTRPS